MWIFLTIIIFSVINIYLAKVDAVIIFNRQKISHGLNGLVYLILLTVPYLIFRNWFLIASLCFNRLLYFNIALSVFRGYPFGYMPMQPKSIIDKIAKFIFGLNGYLMYTVYLIIFISLIILSYIYAN